MGRMQRGLGLRHGIRSKVPGRPGNGRWRFPESDELAQQQSRQKGMPTVIIKTTITINYSNNNNLFNARTYNTTYQWIIIGCGLFNNLEDFIRVHVFDMI